MVSSVLASCPRLQAILTQTNGQAGKSVPRRPIEDQDPRGCSQPALADDPAVI